MTGIVPFAVGVIAVGWIYPFLVYQLDGMLGRRDRRQSAAALAVQAE